MADFRPKSLLYTCGTAKYNDLPEGYTNMPSDALCIGTDVGGNSTVAPATLPCGCNTCPPNTFWQWDSTNSRCEPLKSSSPQTPCPELLP